MSLRDHNKQEEILRVVVRDRFNSCRAFPVGDYGNNEDGKNKEEQSRTSVFETGESSQIPSSKPNPTSYPLETNSNPFYTLGQPETSSINCVIRRTSSLVQFWEGRSNSSLSQSLPNSMTSFGLSFSDRSNSSSFSEEIDWFPPQSDMSDVSNSYDNDREGRCFLEPAYKQEIASGNNNGSKKPEVERKPTEGEGLGNDTGQDKILDSSSVKESEETNKSSLSFSEKVNLWDSKERANRRRVNDVKTVERDKERRKKEEGKSMEIEEYRINPQEITSVVCSDRRNEEETASPVFRESGKEEKSSQNDEETSKAEKQEASETLYLVLETPIFPSDRDQNVMEYKEDYNGETMYDDWISKISRPRSYWEALKKQREDDIMNKNSEQDDIPNLIKIRTVSSFLVGDFREKIDKIIISCVKKSAEVESNLVDEEEDHDVSLVECPARYQGNLEENETEMVELEPITETEMLSDLRKQVKQLQREMLELQSLVKSCVDFQKSMRFESLSVSDSLERN